MQKCVIHISSIYIYLLLLLCYTEQWAWNIHILSIIIYACFSIIMFNVHVHIYNSFGFTLPFSLCLFLVLSLCVWVFMQNVVENRCCCFVVCVFFWQVKFECMKNKISNHFLVSFARGCYMNTLCRFMALGYIRYYITTFYSRFVLSPNGISICNTDAHTPAPPPHNHTGN